MATFDVIDHSVEVKNELHKKVDAILEAVGLHLEGEAKKALEMTPRRVDTGLLRNSITHAVSGNAPAQRTYSADKGSPPQSGSYNGTVPDDPLKSRAVYIGTNVEYAIYVHEGARHMAPNRFIKNAVELNAEQVEGKIRDALSSN